MTHGDKAKAKTGKSSSQTSAKKVSKAVEAKAAGGKEKGGKGGQAAGKKQAGREKAAPALKKGGSSGAKDFAATASSPDAKGKASTEGIVGTGFSNTAVASAFKHAVKKYPNAFRRLTD